MRAMMTPHIATHFAREWADAWNSRDLERVLSHYAEDFEMTSPLIASLEGRGDGTLTGKEAVRAYWKRALDRLGAARFTVLDVCIGATSLCIRYRSVQDITAMEVLWFNGDGKIARASAHYATLDLGHAAGERSWMYVTSLTPILNVTDLDATFGWFVRLGWRKCWEWRPEPGGPASFGAVGSGQSEIFLCLNGQGGRGKSALTMTSGPGGDDCADRGVWMSVWVPNVDEVHARCLEQDIEVTWPPTDEPWGVREMHVRHPDGHVLRISTGK